MRHIKISSQSCFSNLNYFSALQGCKHSRSFKGVTLGLVSKCFIVIPSNEINLLPLVFNIQRNQKLHQSLRLSKRKNPNETKCYGSVSLADNFVLTFIFLWITDWPAWAELSKWVENNYVSIFAYLAFI